MTESLKELYKDDFTAKRKIQLRDNIEIAVKAHKSFIYENQEYFNNPKKQNVVGHLRTYAIERQLYNGAFTPNSSYSAMYTEVNKFKYQALVINTENFIINVARTTHERELPAASKYRLKYARGNGELSGQLSLFENEYEKMKYAIVTYGFDIDGNIAHMGIMIPTEDLKGFYNYDSLLGLPKELENGLEKVNEEKEIVKLKKELQIQAPILLKDEGV